MATSGFWEKYKHPRWQEKRLRIMERAGFECEHCARPDKTLNVHHKFYRKGANPWDYADHELECLCEDCHEHAHGLKRALNSALAQIPHHEIAQVLGYAAGLKMLRDYDERGMKTQGDFLTACDVFGWEAARGMANAFGLLSEIDVDPAIKEDGSIDVEWLARRISRKDDPPA